MSTNNWINYRNLGITLEDCPICKISPYMTKELPYEIYYIHCLSCGVKIKGEGHIVTAFYWNREISTYHINVIPRNVIMEKYK